MISEHVSGSGPVLSHESVVVVTVVTVVVVVIVTVVVVTVVVVGVVTGEVDSVVLTVLPAVDDSVDVAVDVAVVAVAVAVEVAVVAVSVAVDVPVAVAVEVAVVAVSVAVEVAVVVAVVAVAVAVEVAVVAVSVAVDVPVDAAVDVADVVPVVVMQIPHSTGHVVCVASATDTSASSQSVAGSLSQSFGSSRSLQVPRVVAVVDTEEEAVLVTVLVCVASHELQSNGQSRLRPSPITAYSHSSAIRFAHRASSNRPLHRAGVVVVMVVVDVAVVFVTVLVIVVVVVAVVAVTVVVVVLATHESHNTGQSRRYSALMAAIPIVQRSFALAGPHFSTGSTAPLQTAIVVVVSASVVVGVVVVVGASVGTHELHVTGQPSLTACTLHRVLMSAHDPSSSLPLQVPIVVTVVDVKDVVVRVVRVLEVAVVTVVVGGALVVAAVVEHDLHLTGQDSLMKGSTPHSDAGTSSQPSLSALPLHKESSETSATVVVVIVVMVVTVAVDVVGHVSHVTGHASLTSCDASSPEQNSFRPLHCAGSFSPSQVLSAAVQVPHLYGHVSAIVSIEQNSVPISPQPSGSSLGQLACTIVAVLHSATQNAAAIPLPRMLILLPFIMHTPCAPGKPNINAGWPPFFFALFQKNVNLSLFFPRAVIKKGTELEHGG